MASYQVSNEFVQIYTAYVNERLTIARTELSNYKDAYTKIKDEFSKDRGIKVEPRFKYAKTPLEVLNKLFDENGEKPEYNVKTGSPTDTPSVIWNLLLSDYSQSFTDLGFDIDRLGRTMVSTRKANKDVKDLEKFQAMDPSEVFLTDVRKMIDLIKNNNPEDRANPYLNSLFSNLRELTVDQVSDELEKYIPAIGPITSWKVNPKFWAIEYRKYIQSNPLPVEGAQANQLSSAAAISAQAEETKPTGTIGANSVILKEAAKPTTATTGQVNVKTGELVQPTEIPIEETKPESKSAAIPVGTTPSTQVNTTNILNTQANTASSEESKSIQNIQNVFERVDNYAQSVIEKSAEPTVKSTTPSVNVVQAPGSKTSSAMSSEKVLKESASTSTKSSEKNAEKTLSIYEMYKMEEARLTGVPYQGSASGPVSNVSVSSNNFMDTDKAQSLVKPDRSVEQKIENQTKAVTSSINNLNNSVTSMTPISSTSTINNVSSTNNNSNASTENKVNNQTSSSYSTSTQAQQVQSAESSKAVEAEMGFNQNAHYLQAIYAALMSGKIKVKLESH